jgi:hypothetical protein
MMAPIYKLTAEPFLLTEGEFKGHLETVSFTATSGEQTHRWQSVNTGTYVEDFSKIVSPELSQDIVNRLLEGRTVEFPNHYELDQLRNEFGQSFRE